MGWGENKREGLGECEYLKSTAVYLCAVTRETTKQSLYISHPYSMQSTFPDIYFSPFCFYWIKNETLASYSGQRETILAPIHPVPIKFSNPLSETQKHTLCPHTYQVTYSVCIH